jgi:GntR family transcriptional regulator, rspAB operon transcriptional repressor
MGSKNTDIAYEEIKHQIFKGVLRPGQTLTEEGLSATLEMSRTPVRESLIRLESEGLIRIVNGRGAFVSNITPVDIAEIYQLRILIEPFAARACVGRVDTGKIRELRDSAVDLIRSEDYVNAMLKSGISLYESHSIQELHYVIMNAVGNRRLIKILDMLQSQIKWVLSVAERIPERIIRSIGEHVVIADAILDGNGELAEKAMLEHLQTNMNDILDVKNYGYVYHNQI